MNSLSVCCAAVVMVALAVAACTDAPRTSVTIKAPNTRQFVTTSFPLWVEVRGAPFAGQAEGMNETITASMKQAYVWNTAAEFTTNPDEALGLSTKIVMTFNGAASISSRMQCEDRSEGGEDRLMGQIHVVATLCSAGDAISNVRGSLAQTTGPKDPRFSALIRQTTRDMFRRDPDGRRSGMRF